jgi:diphosphomevalonate decarboxylase
MQTKEITGNITWRSPSNIALVKYWGKKPVQVPSNPSISMTLSKAFTEMTLEYMPRAGNSVPFLEFLFEGKQNGKFADKISAYLQPLAEEFPVIKEHCFKISSFNTFPHSTGIASSASSMSALGLCIAEFLALAAEKPMSIMDASRLARLASGSACRSVYGGFVAWGRMPQYPGTTDDFAIPVPFEVHPSFKDMKDAILVVSSKEKDISSRAGHSLMDRHPYAPPRYALASSNALSLCEALESGDMDEFVRITESEALNLHALMMSSQPSYLLLEPGTLSIIRAARQFRKETSVPLCFTLDAGPNVHILYPKNNETEVIDWINNDLVKYCEDGRWIDDEIGQGPEKLEIRN